MARPITISDQQIIDAARALVTERGMLATSQQIALRANVSEGTLFKRFRTKTQLLQTALGVEAGQLTAPFDDLARSAGSPIASLHEAARAFMDLRVRVELLAGRDSRAALSLDDSATKLRIIELVQAHLEAAIADNLLRVLDARAFAMAFVSALFGLDVSHGYEADLDLIVALIFRDVALA
jgi:AcrR family transcriptional regulator